MNKRILLEALITEREGMTAENRQRKHLGQSMAYGDEDFDALAEKMRALIEDVPEENHGNGNDKAKTGLEREINRKLDALKDALLVTMKVAWLSAGPTDLRDMVDESRVALLEAWKEEEEVQRGQVG